MLCVNAGISVTVVGVRALDTEEGGGGGGGGEIHLLLCVCGIYREKTTTVCS